MFELRVSGLRTRVLEAGSGQDEEAVLFLHGSPGSANHWDDLLGRVGPLARSAALDFPGFGAADKPRRFDYSLEGWGAFAGAAADELGIRRVHLVMSDIGAAGLFWAVGNPDRFASAVMINAGALIGYRWHWVARLHRTPVVGGLAAGTRIGFRPVMRFYNGAPRRLPEDLVEGWWREYDWGTRRAMLRFYRATPASATEPIVSALRRLDRPALVLWGAHDRFVPLEQAERQRESFPRAEVVVLPESGHYPHLDDPARVAEAVVPFLRQRLSG
jgi:pimeloyl-ACP methyl ester carboxylesterase